MILVYYGKVGTSEYGLLATSDGLLPPAFVASGYVIVSGFPPEHGPAGEHGAYFLLPNLTWNWVRQYIQVNLPTYIYYDELAQTRVLKYDDDFGVPQVALPAMMGCPSTSQMSTADTATLNSAKTYSDTNLATGKTYTDTSLAKTARGKVTTDASGNWTFNYASKGYTVAPIVSTDVEGAGGFVVNITSVTTTAVSGNVVKPKNVVLGLLPYDAAGVGTVVHVIASPTS